MDKKTITGTAFTLLLILSTCWTGECVESLGAQREEELKTEPVEVTLKQLNQQTKKLKSYQSRIEYRFSQPLFESETLRNGVLYYQRTAGKSATVDKSGG